ncbi:OmpA family protein [Roseovarius sp.]|uniref:OmpA family protein n=1 Tax=Roseovarius sp. TaxID=1486281 RepID=UPI0035197FD7
MSKRVLKSTTALVMSATLAIPAPLFAQDSGVLPDPDTLQPCVTAEGEAWPILPPLQAGVEMTLDPTIGEMDASPVVKPTGAMGHCVIEGEAGAKLVVEGSQTDAGEVYARKSDVEVALTEAGVIVPLADVAGATADAVTSTPLPEAEVTPEASADASADATADTSADASAAASADAPAEATVGAAAEAETKPEEELSVSEDVVAPLETETTTETTTETMAETVTEAEAQAAAEAEAEARAAAEAAEAAQTEAELEQALKAAEATDPAASATAETTGEATAETTAETTAESDATVSEGKEVEPIVEGAKTMIVPQEDSESTTADANQAVEAEAASNPDAQGVEVETETVTEENTRSSDEDFSTAANATTVTESDSGLSNFEKFALGALGAVAVGTILNNGNKVLSNSGDRVVVERSDGEIEVLKDDNVLLRRPGAEVTTERFSDGSVRETVTRANGVKVVTIKASNGQVLRRVRVLPDGQQIVLFDDTVTVEPVEVTELPRTSTRSIQLSELSEEELRAALAEKERGQLHRHYTLQQVREIRAVRDLVPVIELEAINFATDSAAITASEAEELRALGLAMSELIERNPNEVFLVEGHTDAVGSASYNLALSDRRAESVALALTEYFDVPPENMVVQGYGEANLKIRTPGPERQNRRATVRRITPLLQASAAQ